MLNVAPEEDIETRDLVALLTRKRTIEPGTMEAYRMDWRERPPAPIMYIHANAWLEETGNLPAYMRMRDEGIRFFRFGAASLAAGKDSHKIYEVFPLGMLCFPVRLWLVLID